VFGGPDAEEGRVPRRTLQWISTSALGRRERADSAWQAIRWWEARRVPFNAIVGFAGVFTGLAMVTLLFVFVALFKIPWDIPDPPIFVVFGIALYGIMANVCYTLGWVAELCVRAVRPTKSDRFASLAFRAGILGSVALTLSPLLPWLILLANAARQAGR
jgi:hypothetical protein